MANFDTSNLFESSFKGFPFYTQSTSHSGGKRLSIHKFINGGTQAEENGLDEKKFIIEAYIGGENYLKTKNDFIKVLDSTGSGELIDMFYGNKTVQVDSWSTSESKSKLGIVTFSITFIIADDKVIAENDIVYNVDLKQESINNFNNQYNPNVGDNVLKDVSSNIKSYLSKSSDSVKFLESKYDFAKDTKSTINSTIGSVNGNIKNTTGLGNDILNISSSFDGILNLDSFGSQDTKSLSSSIKSNLTDATSTTYDNAVDEAVKTNSKVYNITLNAILLQTVIKTLEIVDFATGDDFGDVKGDILDSFDILIDDVETDNSEDIEKIEARQNLLDKYKEGRKEFVTFYTQKYSGLQNLNEYEYTATTSVLDIATTRYMNLDRVDEVIENNDILDPLFVNGNIKLLDR